METGDCICVVCHGRGLSSDDHICPHCNGTGSEPLDIPEAEQLLYEEIIMAEMLQ